MNEQTKLELLKIAAQYACTSIQMTGEAPKTNDEYIEMTKTFLHFLARDYQEMVRILDNR